jgi:hypothetical protein
MRETIGEWKKEWIDTNGRTDELEVLITDSRLDDMTPYIYEGSFVGIPKELEAKKVISNGKICISSVPDRIGAYSLII